MLKYNGFITIYEAKCRKWPMLTRASAITSGTFEKYYTRLSATKISSYARQSILMTMAYASYKNLNVM